MIKKKSIVFFCVWLIGISLLLTACGGESVPSAETPTAEEPASISEEEETTMKMVVQIDEQEFTASLADTEAARALAELLKTEPLTLRLRDYGGFEKVGSLGTELPASDRQITAAAGDIMLYQGNQIVFFYGSNSWNYTELGKIEDLSAWEAVQGSETLSVTLRLAD